MAERSRCRQEVEQDGGERHGVREHQAREAEGDPQVLLGVGGTTTLHERLH